jgi:signal transduction histidine kinase/CheY-like chemotaxis protein
MCGGRGGEEVPSRYEFNIVRKNGEIRNVEISSTLIKDSKGYTGTISFYKDISEKKMMEEQLVQAEKLRALGEMASGVAHDFNNALAVILGNTQLLLYTAKDEGSRETLQTIEKVARDGAQTIRRLQDFTRKRVPQLLFKLDINSIVQDAMEITRPKWKDDVQGRGISIEMVSRLGNLPPVAGNASELREVITNMIFNAVEAMPKGGKIELLTFQRDKGVCIQVRDTGMGMTEEVRRKIFEPFFTTKPFTNTGLGLSMSYGIIQRFGGKIEVESKAGIGTIFTILLPIGTGEKEEPAVSYGMQKGQSARILVVDDEEAVREVLSKILSKVSHQVTVARDGEEGIRLFKEGMFDLVLTDLGMPGLSGWEVCRMIKKINPQTPVGMITGWGMELSQKTMKEYGLDFMISKPFEFNQIVKIVAETMDPASARKDGRLVEALGCGSSDVENSLPFSKSV